MNVYILDRVAKASDNYHEGGGLVVIARDLDHAKELAAAEEGVEVTVDEWEKAKVLPLAGEHQPAVHVHPDAGCC